MCYSYDYRVAVTIDKTSIDRWKSDLRKMTKIYKDLNDSGSSRDDEWEHARSLFRIFRGNLEEWVYKVLLPRPNSDKPESPLEKAIRALVWDFRFHLDPNTLFPAQGGHHNWSKLLEDRDRNIKRYQASGNKAFKEIEIYLDIKPEGKLERRDAVDHFEVGGIQVVVLNFGRTEEKDLDQFLRGLKGAVSRISQAGFAKAVHGLNLTVDFDPHADESLTTGTYNPASDTLRVLPLGLIGKGHGTFTHECGHRFYYKSLPAPWRDHWEATLSSRGVKITLEDVDRFSNLVSDLGDRLWDRDYRAKASVSRARDESEAAKFKELSKLPPGMEHPPPADYFTKYIHRLKEVYIGETVQLEEITEYANTSPTEAFAECFKEWVLKGPRALSPWTRQFFREVCRAGGAKVSSDNGLVSRQR